MDGNLHRHLRPPMEQHQHHSSQGPWFPSPQFQFQHHPQQQELPPRWIPVPNHPPSQFLPPRPPLPPPHYGSYLPPPPPHCAPPPPSWPMRPPQVTQMYGQPDQPWNNSSWPQNQYPDHNITNYNKEDWAAKARAWATAKTAMENQHNQPHSSPLARTEEHNPAYHEYHQTAKPHGIDMQKALIPGPNQHHTPTSHFPPPASYGHETSSYAPYAANDGTSAADAKLVSVAPEGSMLSSSSVYHQELPSSYSSIPASGDKVAGHESGAHQSSIPIPLSSGSGGEFYSQAVPPVTAASSSIEYASYAYGDKKSAESGLVGGFDQNAHVAAIHAWTAPVAPRVVLPPVPPAPQFENSFTPHVLPGHPTPAFGPVSAPNFHPNIPPIGATFSLSPGAPLHLVPSFPGDVTGTFGISERPKKASVPSWLREEIMKKKAAVVSGSLQDESLEPLVHSNDVDDADMFFRKVDQDDNKSINSTKSTEDEDDEVDEEAEKFAAINQEIKRVLTEVLLKVTDELFDEIATKVMEEDDISVKVPTSNKLPPAISVSPTPKASARVLISGKLNNSGEADVDEESSGSFAGNVLGLANYASDDDEVESSEKSTRQNGNDANGGDLLVSVAKNAQHGTSEEAKGLHNVDNHRNTALANSVSQDTSSNKNMNDTTPKAPALSSSNLKSEDGNVPDTYVGHSGRKEEKNDAAGRRGIDVSQSTSIPLLPKGKTEHANSNSKSFMEKMHSDEFQDQKDFKRSSGSEYDSRKGSYVSRHDQKVSLQEPHSSDARKAWDNQDLHKEKIQERNEVDKLKDKGAKLVGRSSDADSRKSSNHVNVKEEDKMADETKRASLKEDGNKKRERREDEEEKSKHIEKKDSHKKHHSSTFGGRSERADSSSTERSGSLHGSSDDDRKMQRHKQSPSPPHSKPRKRQVSRSPHSRRSERKHYAYYSHDRRNRRSRSASPVHQRC